eukprot:COSAG04_NODE_562_length_12576_cov_154.338703_2_plen_425_part_00
MPARRIVSLLSQAAEPRGSRHWDSHHWDSSLTADIGALAGLSLTYLCDPTPAPALLHLLALSPVLSSASFADGALGACACRIVSYTTVSGNVAALAGMPLEYLWVFAAFSRPIYCCDGALTPSACVLAGRYIQNSYVFGDTTALSVNNFLFTRCSSRGSNGGCGSGTLVASPFTYAGRTQAVCCGTALCAGNPGEIVPGYSTRQQPDFPCAVGSPIPTASSTAGYDTTTCCEGFTCAQNDIGPDFPCSEPTHLKPAADGIVAYSQEECCDPDMCDANADAADDHTCALGSLISSASSTVGADDLTCCRCRTNTDGSFVGGNCRERALLLAFKQSGNGAGLESWAAGSEPCGAGWDSGGEGWRGVVCDTEGGSVAGMCAPQPFLICVLRRLCALTDCRWAADPCAQPTESPPASPRTSARCSASR